VNAADFAARRGYVEVERCRWDVTNSQSVAPSKTL
jgi:hypothetical protein